MSRYFKSLIVIVISFVLLYYSIAWAVLRCPHEQYDSNHEVSIHTDETSLNTLGYTRTSPVPLNFQCAGPDYHTELMASSLSPSQFDPSAEIAFRVNGLPALRTLSGSGESDLWLRAVFENPSSLTFLTGLPRYLSISVFRV